MTDVINAGSFRLIGAVDEADSGKAIQADRVIGTVHLQAMGMGSRVLIGHDGSPYKDTVSYSTL